MSNIGIALQLYSVREAAARNLPETLARVRAAGFEYVQWSGMPELPAAQIREALAQAGLKAIAAHVALEPFERDFDAAASFWATVGAPDLAVATMMADCGDTRADWLRGAARLDAAGGRLAGRGMRLSYHNHAEDLEAFAGDATPRLRLLLDSTDPARLCAEFDTAWLSVGGADPAAYLRAYAGRCPVLHVKDVAAATGAGGSPEFVPLGTGVLDWEAIFDAAEEAAVEWYVIEQDGSRGDMFEDLAASYAFLFERA